MLYDEEEKFIHKCSNCGSNYFYILPKRIYKFKDNKYREIRKEYNLICENCANKTQIDKEQIQ